MAKKKIEVMVEDIKYDLEGRLGDAALAIQRLIDKYGPTARIEIGQESESYSYSDREYAYVRLWIKREETDDEYAKRVAQEEERLQQIEARERAEFERLSKQFAKR